MAIRNIGRLFSATRAAVSRPLPFGLEKGASMNPQLRHFTAQPSQAGHLAETTLSKEKTVWSALSNHKWSLSKTMAVFMVVGGACAYQHSKMYDQLLQQAFAISEGKGMMIQNLKGMQVSKAIMTQALKEEEQKLMREYMDLLDWFETAIENAEDEASCITLLVTIGRLLEDDEFLEEIQNIACEEMAEESI